MPELKHARRALVPQQAAASRVAMRTEPLSDAPVHGAGAADGRTGWAERTLEPVLMPAFWFDPGDDGDPYRVVIWFSGRRAGVSGKPKPGDSFTQEVTVEGVVPGSGPVAVTAEVRGISEGDWEVTARPVKRAGSRMVRPYAPAAVGPAQARHSPLSPRRVAVPAGPRATVSTAVLPFTKVPGIVRFAYTGLVLLGLLAGLGLQAVLLRGTGLPAGAPLLYSVYAVAGGLAGAKAWYIVVHRRRKLDGWCIQGFVAGAAAVAAAAPVAGLGIPAGAYYATAVPGLLIRMAIGRPGCFWAGCCTGRPTASRWGIWSSDRIVGCRRFPAQWLEALAALATGLAALAVVLSLGPGRSGPVAIAALAAYTLARQFILGLRAEPPRRSPHSGPLTAAGAAVVLATGIALLALAAA